MTPRERMRFRRTAIVTDLLAVAAALRLGAQEAEQLADAAPAWEPGTLRRKLSAVVLATLENVVNAECSSDDEAERRALS